MKTLVSDVRYALRLLLRSPGFTTAAVLTLALGIGANAGFFSLADATLLTPLDFRDADRLVTVVPSSAYLDYQEYVERTEALLVLLEPPQRAAFALVGRSR